MTMTTRIFAVIPIYTMMPHEAEEGGYWAEILELPGCVTQGETLEELKNNMREAIEAVLERAVNDDQIAMVAPIESYSGQPPQTWTSVGSM